jgi:hypothetical protein
MGNAGLENGCDLRFSISEESSGGGRTADERSDSKDPMLHAPPGPLPRLSQQSIVEEIVVVDVE